METEVIKIRVPKEIMDKIREIARKGDRSYTQQIVKMLREWLHRKRE